MHWFKKKFWIISAGGVIYFFVVTGAIAYYGLHAQPVPADLAVILGNEVKLDETVAPRLQARLDKGVALYQEGLVKKILVSGGIDRNNHDEAKVMKRYLVTQGIPEASVETDSDGANTLASAKNTQKMILAAGVPDSRVVVVSQYFHMARSVYIFHACGIKNVSSASADIVELRDVYSLFREFFAFHLYFVKRCA